MNLRHLRVALLLLAAHHPLCGKFGRHVARAGGLRLCAGCLATWPVAVASLLACWRFGFHGLPLFAAGVALAAPVLLHRVVSLPGPWALGAKLLSGAALAALAWGAFTLPISLALRLAVICTGALLGVVLLAVRLRSILATCRACPWRMDWESCPGMVAYDGHWRDPPEGSPRNA